MELSLPQVPRHHLERRKSALTMLLLLAAALQVAAAVGLASGEPGLSRSA